MGHNISRCLDPPYEYYMRHEYNKRITHYNENGLMFMSPHTSDIKPSFLIHLINLLDMSKYIQTSSSSVYCYDTYVTINLSYIKSTELHTCTKNNNYQINLRMNLKYMNNIMLV